jgi:uncharacterized membrane protein YedE/YeeE
MGHALLGGVLIGLSASLLWLLNGRILGVSGIIGGLFNFTRNDLLWRVFFLLGLWLGGALMYKIHPESFETIETSTWILLVAGILVGFGTRLSNGCTSGHGVCGISRLSPRSIVSTLLFIVAGAATVGIVRHLLGGL